MARFSIYKLTSPSGRSYVGFTSQAVAERWRQHVGRAVRGAKHPLAAAIRKYGAASFTVETLADYACKHEALEAEVAGIAVLDNAYNLSPGGEYDGGAGAARFRELLADPDWRAAYVDRLSRALRNSERHAAANGRKAEMLKRWREANPREVYRLAMRGLRMGGTRVRPADPTARLQRTPKGPAARLHKSRRSAEAAKRHWAEMPVGQKADIHARIAASVAADHAAKSAEEKAAHAAQLAEARKSIDHTVRKARQKEALTSYWTPERRAAFGAAVRARNITKRNSDADI